MKYFLSSILMGAWLVFGPCLLGQESDTLSPRTFSEDGQPAVIEGDILIDTIKRKREHSPKIAALSSALVPGLGQIYNQKYWKVPVVWGGAVALFAYYDFNNGFYHRFKLAVEQATDGGMSAITDPDLGNEQKYDLNTLTLNRNIARRHRDRAVIFMGLLYVANIIDAMVDAHLLDYDISKDLTLHWQPTITPPVPNTHFAGSYGLNVQLRF